MPYRVYILINPSGRRYIGLSGEVAHRLSQHNDGVSKWTAKDRPWTLHWISIELSLSDARKLENRMKRQKGGNGLEALMREFGCSSGS